MGRVQNKVAVITGGASGIGAATARLFVKEGAKVVIADKMDAEGATLATELGNSAAFIHTDVTNESEIKGAIDFAVTTFGRLDCMFNNAGFAGVSGLIEETETAKLDETLSVLFRAVILGIKHAAPILKKQGSGTIISTASVAGLMTGGPHAYSSCKAAVIHLTHSASSELAKDGIRVNCVCPGFIDTPIYAHSLGLPKEVNADLLKAINHGIVPLIHMGRQGQPEEIAEAVLWLASDASSYVTGHALVIDGGLSTGSKYNALMDSVASNFSQA